MQATTDKWNPLSIIEFCEIFKNSKFPFWISGGYAIDLFLGRTSRVHEDLDISIRRVDQTYFQQILSEWDLKVCNPPGSGKLTDWNPKEYLESPVYNIWARKKEDTPGMSNLCCVILIMMNGYIAEIKTSEDLYMNLSGEHQII